MLNLHKGIMFNFFIFGYNTNTRHWKDEEEFAIVRKQLKDLEDDGKMETKFYTFVDGVELDKN